MLAGLNGAVWNVTKTPVPQVAGSKVAVIEPPDSTVIGTSMYWKSPELKVEQASPGVPDRKKRGLISDSVPTKLPLPTTAVGANPAKLDVCSAPVSFAAF